MAKKSQSIGAGGEQIAEMRLRGIGLGMVEKIGTPVKLVSIPKRTRKYMQKFGFNPNGVFRVIFGEKVSGDRRALVPGSGVSVLIETKTILDRNLRWSDLRDHQPGRLDYHVELGGISLLAWVHQTGVYVLQWPVPDFGPRKSITVDQARWLEIEDINGINTKTT